MWYDVLFWLYNAQTVCCFSVSDNYGQMLFDSHNMAFKASLHFLH